MPKRIGYATAVIKDIESAGKTPLQARFEGIAELEGKEEEFISDLEELAEGAIYEVIYERTETITGEPTIEIHEIIHE